jgi:DTW domain-containing protein
VRPEAALALEGAVLHDHARGRAPSGDAVAALLDEPPALLLYPGPGPAARPPVAPRTIVVPDATWAQARRMVQRLAPLRALPRLALPIRPAPATRLRRSAVPGRLSTLEAIAAALHWLGEPEAAGRLQALHAEAVERTLRLKGMWPPGRDPHRLPSPRARPGP